MDRVQKIRELLLQSPDDGFLQHALALEMVKLGDDQLALSLFEQLLTRQPGYIGSYYHLGKLLEKTGDKERAKKWYIQGIEEAEKAGEQRTVRELNEALENLEENDS